MTAAAFAALSLGSNLGGRESYIRAMESGLRAILADVRVSGLMETAPVGVDASHPPYLNKIVVGLYAGGGPYRLLKACQSIESRLGRTRDVAVAVDVVAAPKSPRTADIDILLFGDIEIAEPDVLIIPHPELINRRFCLEGLMSIDPKIVVPRYGRLLSVKELYENMGDDVAAQNVSLIKA
jgi:2-amino-4-hydroxy-6-hydroxymethyldihydropteridine diphosphokinase